MPIIPDEALSSPSKEVVIQPTPDQVESATKVAKRKAPPPEAAVATAATEPRLAHKRTKPSRGDENSQDDCDDEDDRKLPAKDKTTDRPPRNKGGKSDQGAIDKASRRSSSNVSRTSDSAVATDDNAIPTKHLLIGKGAQVWNARLQEISSSTALPKQTMLDDPPVTAMELLQQAQERLRLAPTRFPPRESPLHTIFQSTPAASGGAGDPKIFSCLQECYREMLMQDVQGEEALRQEYYNKIFKKRTTTQQRIGQIFAEENRLKKKEQAMLSKLKGWLST